MTEFLIANKTLFLTKNKTNNNHLFDCVEDVKMALYENLMFVMLMEFNEITIKESVYDMEPYFSPKYDACITIHKDF